MKEIRLWLVTHTNLSDEKFYYKVRAACRARAKQIIQEKHNLYLRTLTAHVYRPDIDPR